MTIVKDAEVDPVNLAQPDELRCAMEKMMDRRKALMAAFCALSQLRSAFAAEPQTPTAAPSTETPASYGGAFILIDHHGKTVMDEDFRGKYMLVAFGYTSCPDICPTMLTDLTHAVDLLGEEGAAVQPLFVTLDPARDTPARLADYVSSFSPRLTGLTGPEALIADVARKYRIKFTKVIGNDGAYSIDHTAAMFLMGRDGQFLDRFVNGTAPEKIAEKIRQRMKSSGI